VWNLQLGDEHFDRTATIDDHDKDVAAVATGPSRAFLSLYSMLKRVQEIQLSHHTMMETFMTT